MKQNYTKSLLVGAFAAACCIPTFAAKFTIGNQTFETRGTEEAIFTGYVEDQGPTEGADVTLPTTVLNSGKVLKVTAIGGYAFYQLNVNKIILNEQIDSIGQFAFCQCLATDINLDVTKIGFIPTGLFTAAMNITEFTIPGTVKYIQEPDNWMLRTNSLLRVNVAEGCTCVKSVDGVLFTPSGKTLLNFPGGIKEYTIPEGTDSISPCAFQTNETTEVINLASSVKSIGRSAFYYMSKLKTFNIPADSQLEEVWGGAFGSWPLCNSRIVIPESCTTFKSTFKSCPYISYITMPTSFTDIPSNFMNGCIRGWWPTFKGAISSIGSGAFQSCAVQNLDFSNGSFTKVPVTCFDGATGLKTLALPATVNEFDVRAMYKCSGLKTLTLNSPTPPSAFSSASYPFLPAATLESCELRVPAEAIEAYKAHEIWGQFAKIASLAGVESALVEANEPVVRSVNGGVEVENAAQVEVYTAAGQKVYSGAAGTIELNPGALYIVRAGGKTVKVLK